ncbi:MAG: NAD-dependent epimerase/dehydratase family protein [Deltaproteobacteria bacterium]|nr:NAD-dependent epimerase/dehydratase family protein [Deltaproteobacteria bacterium]
MDYKGYYKGKTILVTGGVGAIGSNLVRALADAGAGTIIVLDDLSSSSLWNLPSVPGLLFVEGSVSDEIKLKRVFNERPDIVFHLAAFFANQNSVDYPESDLEVNGLGTLRMLEYSVMNRVEKFVYASSGCAIYGAENPLPFKEDFISMHLTTPYQITKMLGELYSNFFMHHHGLKIVKPRFFNSYGPGEIPGQYRNVIPNFIYWALSGKPLVITGTGKETRDFTWVGDINDGLLRAGAFEEAVGEEFNLASGQEVEIGNLAEMVVEMTGSTAGIEYGERRAWDTKSRLLASVEKARGLIGYDPGHVPFEEGLRLTVEWVKGHWDLIRHDASFTPGVSSANRKVRT